MQDEQALLARARGLDAAALAEIHDTTYPLIFRYIAFRVGSREVAEDLTSEVFARLLGALNERRAPERTLTGWLYGVASHVVGDHLRQRYRHETMPLAESLASREPDPVEQVETLLAHEALREAIGELTEDQQDVIALRFGYGMPIAEVARTMGKTEGAVKQLQARAVARLSRRLAPGVEP